MANLTKQEIQDARRGVEEYCASDLGEDGYNTVLQALDIAEKQVWLPISGAEDEVDECLLLEGEYISIGYFDGKDWYVSNNGDYDDATYGRDYKCGVGKEYTPTHYMPLPTPRV